jgi:glutaredoxin
MNTRAAVPRKLLWSLAIALIFVVGVFGGRGAIALVQWASTPDPVAFGDQTALLQRVDAEVVLFSLSTCPYCKQAHAWLTENRIPFKELVVDQSASAQNIFDELKEPGLPVLVARDRLIRGFSADAYAEALVPAADIPDDADAVSLR